MIVNLVMLTSKALGNKTVAFEKSRQFNPRNICFGSRPEAVSQPTVLHTITRLLEDWRGAFTAKLNFCSDILVFREVWLGVLD